MANNITFSEPLMISLKDSGVGGKLMRMGVIMDTPTSDFTLYTPAAENYAALVGIVYGETTASSLTFKSSTTTICVMERSSNSFLAIPTDKPLLIGGKGEPLVLNVSVAITGTIFLTIAEFRMLSL